MLGYILSSLAVLWCSYSASSIFASVLHLSHQRFLVGYPVGLLCVSLARLFLLPWLTHPRGVQIHRLQLVRVRGGEGQEVARRRASVSSCDLARASRERDHREGERQRLVEPIQQQSPSQTASKPAPPSATRPTPQTRTHTLRQPPDALLPTPDIRRRAIGDPPPLYALLPLDL